jgi:hypothetical protein
MRPPRSTGPPVPPAEPFEPPVSPEPIAARALPTQGGGARPTPQGFFDRLDAATVRPPGQSTTNPAEPQPISLPDEADVLLDLATGEREQLIPPQSGQPPGGPGVPRHHRSRRSL